MKMRVISELSDYYKQEFHVLSMNYDNIIVRNGHKNMSFGSDEAELIAENSSEEIIVKCKDILKIRLVRGMTFAIYIKLVSFIEDNINGNIKKIEVLKDEYSLIKKGLWEKNISAVINNKYPVDINIIGKNYSNAIDIVIKNKNIEQFKDECNIVIKMSKAEIQEKKKYFERYEKALKTITENYS